MKCYKSKNCKLHPRTTRIKLTLWLFLLVMFTATAGVCFDRQCLAEPQIISPVLASPLSSSPALVEGDNEDKAGRESAPPVKTEQANLVETEKQEAKFSQEEIDDYIDTIFGGKDGRIMRAINRVECNPANKAYPECVYHTEHEYSVGIFQINLFNSKHWIHAKKVPGETMEEKVEALKDPYINTLVAYKIFSDSSFTPWAGFTSGRYKAYLD